MGSVLLSHILLFWICGIFLSSSLTWALPSYSHATTPILSMALLAIFTGCMCALLLRNISWPFSKRDLGNRQQGSQDPHTFPSMDNQEKGTERHGAVETQPLISHLSLGVLHSVTEDTETWSCHIPPTPFLLITLSFTSVVTPLISTQPMSWIRRL